MARGLRLKRFSIKNANHWHLRVFRLRIEVTETTSDMTPFVFVYRRHPADPFTGDIFDEFCTVASPVDLVEYPVGQPNVEKPFPFFRKDFIEVDLRSQRDFDKFWDLVSQEVCRLVEALGIADILINDDEIVCGELPQPSESVSESVSVSVS